MARTNPFEFLQQVRTEVAKVTWPTRRETVITTIMMTRKFDGGQALKSSSPLTLIISPDGNRVLKRQAMPDGKGSSTFRLSVAPFGGSGESPIEADGRVMADIHAGLRRTARG